MASTRWLPVQRLNRQRRRFKRTPGIRTRGGTRFPVLAEAARMEAGVGVAVVGVGVAIVPLGKARRTAIG
jgi:hypothetical protein